MFEDSIKVLHLNGDEKNILQAEEAMVKIPRTGIFLCTGGWVNLTLDGVNYHLTKDCMIVYFAYSSLHITNHSTPITGTLIGADLETIQPLLYNVSDFNAIFVIKQNPLVMLTLTRINRLVTYTTMLENTLEKQKEYDSMLKLGDTSIIPAREIILQQRKLLGQCLMLEIISSFIKSGTVYKLDNRRDDVLKNFMESLYHNYKQEHEVSFYAQEQNLTCRYFSSIIKDRSGQTPSTWIATALLVEAKQLLQSTPFSVKDISDRLNFPNQSYFGKWFKNHTGISPLEFKSGKAIKENKEAELAKFIQNNLFAPDKQF
ncbi:MAG: helix-turn-helix transcriptional regulator [Bacteroidaceae bacterium]|nr:helix-turn-helix transcriptional regulator [Bacteroidaceae bacterium]